MKTIRWHVWVGVMVMVAAVLVLFSRQRVTTPTEAPNAFLMDPVQRNAGAPAAQPTPFAVVEPKEPQWPECSLPLYPTNAAASRRIVSDTHNTEIVYETQWVQSLDDADRDTFVARAKQWTPECRMLAIKKACATHCIYDDKYMAIIEAAADVVEAKALVGAVLTINEAVLKRSRSALAATKQFAAYADTVVPHSSSTPGGQACLDRMRRDHARLARMRQDAFKPFTMTIVTAALVHATGCVTCSERTSRERDCKWMHEEIANGESRLREAEEEHADMRKVATRMEKR